MNPLLKLSPLAAKTLFHTMLWGAAAVGGAMMVTGHSLNMPGVPGGIFALELNFGTLPQMMAHYDARTLHEFAFQLGLDYLFIPIYSTGIAAGILCAHYKRNLVLPGWTSAVCWALWISGALDGIENIFLYRAVLDGPTAALGWGATICAGIKFLILVFAGLIWLRTVMRKAT